MYRLIPALVGLAVVAGCMSPETGRLEMEERNTTVVRGYMEEVLNKGDMAAVGKYFADGFTFNGDSFDATGLAGMRAFLSAGFPDFHLTIVDQFAAGDRVVTRVSFRGTHEGNILGVAPTGREVVYTGIAIDRLIDGKVVEMWHEADMWGLYMQLTAGVSGE